MKSRGARHTYAEKLLMAQVKSEFGRIKKKYGAQAAARKLRVSVPSFYNYVRGTDLPRMEVLRSAHELWGIRWKHIDSSQFVSTVKVKSPEQFVLPFLDAVHEKDVTIADITREGEGGLRIAFSIRFPTQSTR